MTRLKPGLRVTTHFGTGCITRPAAAGSSLWYIVLASGEEMVLPSLAIDTGEADLDDDEADDFF
jgi:hypothetical protein